MSIDSTKRPKQTRRVAGKRRANTDPGAPHDLMVKGLTSAEVASLDAITDQRNTSLRAQGASTSRNAVIVATLREFIARESK
jgi:hypothetical protein